MGSSATFTITDAANAAIITLRCQMDGQPTGNPADIFSALGEIDLTDDSEAAYQLLLRLRAQTDNRWRLVAAPDGEEEWRYELSIPEHLPPRLFVRYEGEDGSGTLFDNVLENFTPTTAEVVEAAAAQFDE